ncbi:MAG: purine and other phosphorylase-like protein, family 1 [Gammaproteobacteria bacterium]|nr:purine and other phosphorylase-like protein, family 1 [Gammaproteobacteria bacterium]
MIGVIAAMRAEARSARPLKRNGCCIVTAGMGARCAREAARRLLDNGADRLLAWGSAGALVGGLGSGTLLLPREVLDRDGKRFAVTADWHDRLWQKVPHGVAVNGEPIVTVSRPVSGCGAKAALHDSSGAVAVDMETAAIAALAAEYEIAFAAVRAIVDPLELELPPVVLKARSERFAALEVPLRLLGRPRDLGALARLSRAMHAATRSLATYARALAETAAD